MDHQTIQDVIQGRIDCCVFTRGQPANEPPADTLLPGSFNPLHQGHTGMAAYVGQLNKTRVDFELSVANVDKATISVDEVKQRIEQFTGLRIWITRAATFAEKAELFPGRNFIVGADTAFRLFDRKYYDSPQKMTQTFDRIQELGCRFLVFGRKVSEDFEAAESMPIPERYRELFTPIAEQHFRMDISSRELRAKGME